MSRIDILLRLIVRKLCLEGLLNIFSLILEVEYSSVPGRIHHLSLHCVYLFRQKGNTLSFIGHLALVLRSTLHLLVNYQCLVFSHLI